MLQHYLRLEKKIKRLPKSDISSTARGLLLLDVTSAGLLIAVPTVPVLNPLQRLKQHTIQQTRTMNDSQDDDLLVGDAKDCPVVTVDEMPVESAKNPIFGNQRTVFGERFQRFNLFR